MKGGRKAMLACRTKEDIFAAVTEYDVSFASLVHRCIRQTEEL